MSALASLLLGLAVPAHAAPAEVLRHFAPPQGVELVAQERAWPGGTLVRATQRVGGLPVHGRALVASLGTDGRLRRATGRVVTPLRMSAPVPAVDSASATARARSVAARLGRGELWGPRAELVWLDRGELVLAWSVDVSTADPVGTWRTWIDATTGEVLRTDGTSRSARAWLWTGDPLGTEPVEVALAGLDAGAVTLSGGYVVAGSCDEWTIEEGWFGTTACDASSAHAVADVNGDFFFEPEPGGLADPQAEVQVYVRVDEVSAWLAERYAFTHPDPLAAYVNFPMTNAFYGDFDGDGVGDLSFGHDEASGVDFGYDADVVHHEFGHSVVGALADLPFLKADGYGMDWVAGSVNEGYADVLAMVLSGDALVGEYAGSSFAEPAIRDLGADRRCPDDLVGEVHADGEILGSVAWNLVERLGADATSDVFWGALPFWGPDVSWPLVGQSLLDSAADLVAAGALGEGDLIAVEEEVARANLLDCGRVLPLDDGETTTQYLMNTGLLGDLERVPLGVQFSIDVPADATVARIAVEAVEGHDGLGWAVYGRVGEHVEHEVVSVDGLGLAVASPEVYDWSVDGHEPETLELVVGGEPPLVPGETLYFAVTSRNLGSILPLDVQFGTIALSASTGSGPATQAEEAPGGCGCATGARGGQLGLFGAAVALLGLRRARRRP